ncbi:MAG: hypothetical protein R3F60_19680 [bacterium]
MFTKTYALIASIAALFSCRPHGGGGGVFQRARRGPAWWRRGPRRGLPCRGRGLAAGYRWAGTALALAGRRTLRAALTDAGRQRRAHHQRPGGARGGRRAGEHWAPSARAAGAWATSSPSR